MPAGEISPVEPITCVLFSDLFPVFSVFTLSRTATDKRMLSKHIKINTDACPILGLSPSYP